MDFGFWILDFKLFCGSEQRPWWMEQIQKTLVSVALAMQERLTRSKRTRTASLRVAMPLANANSVSQDLPLESEQRLPFSHS
ncbi:hypothetical protein [uncultured Nostoc sp.]|uniref:hypothetical protein n=1 Tax=uncultured Nostoc sp. TaxID=340711 RepID=UPI0035CC2F91